MPFGAACRLATSSLDSPKHGSWLNMAEIEIGVALRQCLDRRMATQEAIENELLRWASQRNDQHYGTDWRFTTKDARIKLKQLSSTLLE